MPLYIVDTIVQERHRYIIEADEIGHAYDEVTIRQSGNPHDDFLPLSVKDLGETIVDGRLITLEDLEKEFVRLDNEHITGEVHRSEFGPTIIRKINYDI